MTNTDALIPNATYKFTVTPVTDIADNQTTEDGNPLYNGVPGGVSDFEISTSETLANTKPTAGTVTVGETKVGVDVSVFDKPGVFRYTVQESEPDYAGVTITDNTAKTLDVYIVRNEETNAFEVAYVLLHGVDTAAEKVNGVFTNTYTTYDVTITKAVTGDMGNKSTDFNFTVGIKSADEKDDQFAVTTTGNELQSTTLKAGETTTVNLKDGNSVTIHGLTAGDVYTLMENTGVNKDDQGYTTTITGAKESDNTKRTASGSVDGADVDITVTNHKDPTTPTGIVMDIAPYIIMVAAAGVLAFVFLRRRSYTK